jgi:hypothetical protein
MSRKCPANVPNVPVRAKLSGSNWRLAVTRHWEISIFIFIRQSPALGNVKGYKDGKEAIMTELQTAGEPVNISLQPLFPSVNDGQDVVIVEALLKYRDGKTVQHDDRKITFTVEGAGTLVGIENGDLRIREPIRTNTLSTYF